MREDTGKALKFVLLEKIYPVSPSLMRNDTKASVLVEDYVFQMIEIYWSSIHIRPGKLTELQVEAVNAYFSITPLEGISSESIRKYIRLLWQSGAIEDCIFFKT